MKTICASCGVEVEAASGDCPKCEDPVLLAGRYRLVEVLGRGANGITYRAERTTDGNVFAVKEMSLRTLESAKAMELFDREARVLRELDHPAIPRYEDDFHFGQGKNAALYLVQELVSGRTLEAEMASKRYDVAEVLAIVSELAEVLEYLHRRSPPVVHRDVKPKNVMRRDDGRLVLIDFGSVRDALSTRGGSTVAGTFGYMAPEQLAGKATPASDVYALGALAVALLTRKEPDTLLGDDHRIDVREHVDAPDEVLALLEEMLDARTSSRIQRACEIAERAREIAARTTPEAAPQRKRGPRKARNQHHRRKVEPPRAKPTASTDVEEKETPKDEPSDPPSTYGDAAGDVESLLSSLSRWNGAWLVVGIGIVSVLIVGFFGYRSTTRTTEIAVREVGVAELYARPVIADVNGDGVEDAILVTGIDRGPDTSEDGEDTWGKENGNFDAFVQAIDGKDGKVLWSVKQGRTYVSTGNDAKTSARIVVLAGKTRIGIARVPASGHANLTIHDLATGKELKQLAFDQVTGAACENRGLPGSPKGTFYFARAGNTSGTVVDLERATATSPAPSSCADLSTTSVADVPAEEITNRTLWSPRYSPETMLRQGAGQYGGRMIVVDGSGRGFVVVARRAAEREREPAASGPTISIDDGDGLPARRDNAKIDVVGLDVLNGKTLFERSLASLGFTTQTVDHIEPTDHGPLLFFEGNAGLALLDPERGERKWSLALPKGDSLSTYTLSKTRAYLHVFGPDPAVYGFLSKKLRSRVLVVDLASGKYVRSLPEGPLDPEPPSPKRAFDSSTYKPVANCSCVLSRRRAAESKDWASMTVEQRRQAMEALATKGKDGGTRVAGKRDAGASDADAGLRASSRVQLRMYTRSSTESAGRKWFGVAYALDVDDTSFVLPHYDEIRDRISPPRTLEGDVSLGVACGEDAIVFVADRLATAWSIDKRDELWTVELPVSRAEPKTTLGGGASLSCAFGRIEKGRVHVPAMDGPGPKEIVLRLEDGAVIQADAGRPPPKH